eukprot:s445_g15.t1
MIACGRTLQFCDPRVDIIAFLKECIPIVYNDYGKTISHYGGLRLVPHQAVEYAAWGKAKQLAWDRAYDKDGELCYICYYAGFMKVLLTPEERRELYNGVSSPREELLGVLETH